MSHLVSFRRFALSGAAAFTLGFAPVAQSDPGDHLTCFRVKTTEAFDAASVDLAALLPGFDVSGCKVAKKAQVYCVPSTKTVTNLDGGTPVAVDGDTQVRQRLCYKIRCETSTAQVVDATDQFGTRTLEVGKPVTVCTPAVPGDGPTTTTTLAPCVDADGDGYGTDCTSGPDCDDGNALVHPDATETCNGKDDDCDTVLDEADPLLGSACMTGQPGVCASGTTTCQSGALACPATTSPSTETCDGLDNNCDGATDESDPLAGSACMTGQPGVCASGTITCQSGALVCPPANSASTETCDGLDNDCDGTTDESDPLAGSACATGQPGICSAGTITCQSGALICSPATPAGTETCDGLDNDCDGVTDESDPLAGSACTTGIPGVCSAGTLGCTSGAMVCSQTTTASSEACDNSDNDCDGTVDDGLARSCYQGPGGTSGVGACRSGTQICSAGSWGSTCPGQVIPVTEICGNGIDDDCDGLTDVDC